MQKYKIKQFSFAICISNLVRIPIRMFLQASNFELVKIDTTNWRKLKCPEVFITKKRQRFGRSIDRHDQYRSIRQEATRGKKNKKKLVRHTHMRVSGYLAIKILFEARDEHSRPVATSVKTSACKHITNSLSRTRLLLSFLRMCDNIHDWESRRFVERFDANTA